MEFTQIKETCLYVHDLDASESFYVGKLGLELISKVESRHVFFKAGSSVLLCFIASVTQQENSLPPHGAKGIIHMALEVLPELYIQSKREVEEAGIEIVHEQSWPNNMKSFYFKDPDGHLIEIVPKGLWEK